MTCDAPPGTGDAHPGTPTPDGSGCRRTAAPGPTRSALYRTGRAAAGRLSWGVADQAVSSLTNFAVGAVVARSLGATAFGVFSLAWVTYGVVLNVSRGMGTDPLVVRFSGAAVASWRAAVSSTSGMALLLGAGGGLLCLAVGGVIGGVVGPAFLGLGLVLPALLLQDSWRYAFFAAGRGRQAFTNDMVWALALVPAMIVASRIGTVFAFLLAWGLSGAVAAGFGYLQTRVVPRPAGIGGWLREQRDLAPRYLVENVSQGASAQFRMYAVGGVAGLGAVGTIRGAELLMGPFLALLMGVGLFAVPEAARVLRRAPRRLPHFCALVGGAQAASALCWGLSLLLLMPDWLGRQILGTVWDTSSALIVPASLSVMNASFATGATAGLRALGAAGRSLRAQLCTSGAYFGFGAAGAVLGGALGSAWGTATATFFGAAVSWWQLRAGLREYRPAGPPAQPAGTPIDEELRTT